MTRTLGMLTLAMLLGCGGEDESPLTAQQAATEQALETQVDREVTERVTRLMWNAELLRWELVQVPVEERFFHVVTPTAEAPSVPPPPCPVCR